MTADFSSQTMKPEGMAHFLSSEGKLPTTSSISSRKYPSGIRENLGFLR